MEKNIMATFKVTNIFKKICSYKKKSPPLPKNLWRNPLYFIAFGFGTGALPAPGTFGTLAAIPIYLLLRPLPLWAYLLILLFFIIASSWLCDKVSKELHVHDHPGMCIDEFVGFLVTMINAPPGFLWIVVGFILFRLFDIFKPWPINYIDENIHGGFGMVLDDIVAGLVSCIIIQLSHLLLGLNS
jgi:phosphatidylglycerophosphatase A